MLMLCVHHIKMRLNIHLFNSSMVFFIHFIETLFSSLVVFLKVLRKTNIIHCKSTRNNSLNKDKRWRIKESVRSHIEKNF